MRLRALRVDGFGRLTEREFAFGPALNVIVGPNEAGKSTLGASIVASLYGLQRGEKDRYRPWNSPMFGTQLTYETADGAVWEVQREFDKDAKGVRVYDADGADAAARVGDGKSLVPGEAHLGISLDVFVQTACVRQRQVALDGDSGADVSAALAQALDGGPKEDAALGALARLDAALRKHVGTQRATKNAPLRRLRAEEDQQRAAVEQARTAIDALAGLRERIAARRLDRDRDLAAAADLQRRVRSLRAAHLRARMANLREYRDELAALQADRAAYDDVAAFPAERIGELDDAYHAWRNAESAADAAALGVAEQQLTDAERAELSARRRDAGALDDDAFEAVRAAAAQADAAHAKAAAAANDAAAARREGDGGRTLGGVMLALTCAATLADAAVAIAHLWTWAALASVIALVFGFVAFTRARSRARRVRRADAKQQRADAALREERIAAEVVAQVLEPLGIPSVEELVRRRERFTALAAREAAAQKAQARALAARRAADDEGARFDTLAELFVPGSDESPERRRAIARERAARRRERDGIDASLAMLTMRRAQILGTEDDFALQAELDALLADGVEPTAHDDGAKLHAYERERAELDARAREAEKIVASLEGELRAGEENVPDVAALDEALAATRAQIARLEAFERAVTLARERIDYRKDEAHRAFARRLEQYSADVLGGITEGRYREIRVEPGTLAIRVRVPETRRIEDVEHLSAGTRDQIALVVRFATARMFAEGLETPPLLLDDPFAFWDTDRIARCLPVLVRGAQEMQTLLLTASNELADAAQAAGATRFDLHDVALSPVSR